MTNWGKTEWRRWAKGARAQLETPLLSKKITEQLEHSSLFRNAEHILTYLAFGTELDLASLLGYPDKQFYATRTHADHTLTVHKLALRRFTAHGFTGGLERHPYGFLQPAAESPAVALERLELLLIPGLAFDRTGTRLGYGKGFYDRLLTPVKNVPVVGVVPSKLIVPALPSEPHDVKMTYLVSEREVLEVRKATSHEP